jgi:hypothetical protein
MPLLSLPAVFDTTLQTIPAAVPYLHPDPQSSSRWRGRIAALPGKRVGLVWAGQTRHTRNRARSIPLDALSPLAQVPNVSFVSLQKEMADQSQISTLDAGKDLTDFADTAAVLDNLDLLITVDTAIAHLAGAMGKPAWVLLPFIPDWRWLLDRNDSPWYPTLRLFRQPTPGDWDTPIRQVLHALPGPSVPPPG